MPEEQGHHYQHRQSDNNFGRSRRDPLEHLAALQRPRSVQLRNWSAPSVVNMTGSSRTAYRNRFIVEGSGKHTRSSKRHLRWYVPIAIAQSLFPLVQKPSRRTPSLGLSSGHRRKFSRFASEWPGVLPVQTGSLNNFRYGHIYSSCSHLMIKIRHNIQCVCLARELSAFAIAFALRAFCSC
jgi:hypothetical protein